MTTTAAAPSEICEALPAVTVPWAVNDGRGRERLSGVVSGRMPSSRSKLIGSPLRLGHVDGDDFLGEPSALPCLVGSSVGTSSPGVLRLTADAQLGVDRVGAGTHVSIVEGAPQPIVDEGVEHGRVAQPSSLASLRKDEGGVRHRLHTARYRDLDLARTDHLIGDRDRRRAREADLVDRECGHLMRDAGRDRRLSCGDLALPGLEHMAHDRVLDMIRARRSSGRALRGSRTHRDRRREARERAPESADRCARAGNDDRRSSCARV